MSPRNRQNSYFFPSAEANDSWLTTSPHSFLGVLFLQYGDETRRVHITHELSSLDTLHALIVHMFPQKLTAGMLKSPNTAILIKDEARNVFYELEDVRDIQDRSIIKIYRKEPIYASYTGAAHLANGDLRVSWGPVRGEGATWWSVIWSPASSVFYELFGEVSFFSKSDFESPLPCTQVRNFKGIPIGHVVLEFLSRPSVFVQKLDNCIPS